MKKIIAAILLGAGFLCMAESVITFPTTEQIGGQKKNLILKIVIPNELQDEEDKTEYKPDFSYFNFNPFPDIDRSNIDWETLRGLARKGLLKRERSRYLVNNRAIKNEYEMFFVLNDIIENIERNSKDDMLDKGVTREDITYIEKLVLHDYSNVLARGHMNGAKVKERLDFLKKQFLAGKGEVQVLRVMTNDAGETMIHIQLQED